MKTWLQYLLLACLRCIRRLLQWLRRPATRPHWRHACPASPTRHPYAQPKPVWVRNEIVRLKALMPEAGCRLIAHHFNRRWAGGRQMTVGKTYVASTLRRHQQLVWQARRVMKHRFPRPVPRNLIWGCDLMMKTDQHGRSHFVLGILDHASRACLWLQRLPDKSALTLMRLLGQTVRCYGSPRFMRTDNEAMLISRLFRLGLWAFGIRHQRIEPGCPWQNGRIERFFGTIKRALVDEPIANGADLDAALAKVRQWYNHAHPHDHLQGRTPAEVWAGIDVFAIRSG